MSKFVVVHPVGGAMSAEDAAPVAKAVKANCTPDAYWIRSWYLPEEGKLYCEWDAKDADSIRAAMTAAAKMVPQPPVEGVYLMAAAPSGEDYR